MKNKFAIMLASAVLAFSSAANASVEDDMKSNRCFTCHSVDKAMAGPAFKDVAAKYKGNAGAAAALGDKIINGASGTWGDKKMPPYKKLTKEQAEAMATWVLGH